MSTIDIRNGQDVINLVKGCQHMDEEHLIIQKPLSELIADQIKRSIWKKELQFGDRLLETELSEKFDVSRSTIREALKILEIEELVISKARKGTYITQFSDKDVEEITELRAMIEARAFIHALPRMEEKHYLDLEKIIAKMKTGAENKDWNELFDLDMQFHRYVVDLSGNSRIVKIYDSLQVQIRTVLMHLDQYYSSFDSFYNEHRELMDGLRTKDINIVKEKVKDHIEYVEEKLLGVNNKKNGEVIS